MNEEELAALVGMAEADAASLVQARGLLFRVTDRDGESYALTADLRTDRVNVSIVNGKVAGAGTG